MATPFLISSIPDNAEFCASIDFVQLPNLLNEVQMVDPRCAEPVIDTDSNTSLLEIKEMQLSQKCAEALCSISLFQQEREYRQPFTDYLNGVQQWIRYFREELPSQKLRIYVGDSAWDILYQANILENTDVDFVRMASSSSKSRVGLFWRFLAFDDFDYEYVYIQDADAWDDMGAHRDPKMNRGVLEWTISDPSVVHIAGHLVIPTRDRDWGWNSDCRDIPLFHELPYSFHEAIIYQVSKYFPVHELLLLRGPRRPSFQSFVPFFLYHWLQTETCVLYHPSLNLWSNFAEARWGVQGWRMNVNWHFYLSKILALKYYFFDESQAHLQWIINRYGSDYFWVRLFKQFVEDGNLLYYKDSDAPIFH